MPRDAPTHSRLHDGKLHAELVEGGARPTSAKASAAAATVVSTSSVVCASDGNQASNWDGGA